VKKALILTAILGMAGAAVLLAPPAADAQKKEVYQLQRDVELLQQEVRELRQTVDRNHAVLKTLLEQSLDSVNRMQQAVGTMEHSVQDAQARTNTRVDSLATQVQSLRDAVDELTARLGRISQQLAETQSVMQSVDARLAPPVPAPAAGTAPPPAGGAAAPAPQPETRPLSAKTLYDNALRDFINGNYDLSRQQFTDYLTYYGRTELAGNAQFYIGETFYKQGDFRRAITEYDKVLDQFPNSLKTAAAYLKKGYALLELDNREAGVASLRTVVEKFPRSEEAKLAQARLERLGQSGTR